MLAAGIVQTWDCVQNLWKVRRETHLRLFQIRGSKMVGVEEELAYDCVFDI